MQNVPANVLILDWLPQHQLFGKYISLEVPGWLKLVDVVAHGATVLFVSHCGMNGVMESLYHRVPLLCMPIFADQPDNAARLVERGLGLALDRYNLNHNLVTEAITEILHNKR